MLHFFGCVCYVLLPLIIAPKFPLSLLSVHFSGIVLSIRAIVFGILWRVGCIFLGM
jgi:hypothetical protein